LRVWVKKEEPEKSEHTGSQRLLKIEGITHPNYPKTEQNNKGESGGGKKKRKNNKRKKKSWTPPRGRKPKYGLFDTGGKKGQRVQLGKREFQKAIGGKNVPTQQFITGAMARKGFWGLVWGKQSSGGVSRNGKKAKQSTRTVPLRSGVNGGGRKKWPKWASIGKQKRNIPILF